jgi:uncharacterized protein
MGDQELDAWLRARAHLKPWATNISMVDGFVAAIVAGPVSPHPYRWIGALLAVDAAAFEVGGTREFAAIRAVAERYNATGERMINGVFAPLYLTAPDGSVDATDWCRGFMAAVSLGRRRWHDILDPAGAQHRLIEPILLHVPAKTSARPQANPTPTAPARSSLKKARRDIPRCVMQMREHFQLQRFGTPHPNTLPKSSADLQPR